MFFGFMLFKVQLSYSRYIRGMIQTIFKRTETKYLLTEKQVEELLSIIEPYLKQDKYFKGTNISIYFDTDEKWLGIHSLEKPLYKEKIRVRSYGVPKSLDNTVFIEIKKKFDGVGYKRRVPIKLKDFYKFCNDREAEYKMDDGSLKVMLDKDIATYTDNPQIEEETRYCFRFYHLKPALFLAYDRTSYIDKDDPTFRLTFDRKVRSRETNLRLEAGDSGDLYFGKKPMVVMEIKSAECYPKWFVDAISRLKIYPASFSKYGRVLQKIYN